MNEVRKLLAKKCLDDGHGDISDCDQSMFETLCELPEVHEEHVEEHRWYNVFWMVRKLSDDVFIGHSETRVTGDGDNYDDAQQFLDDAKILKKVERVETVVHYESVT